VRVWIVHSCCQLRWWQLARTVLPSATGCGTHLSQLIVLGARALVAKGTSGVYADQHDTTVWVVAFFVNLVVFQLIAGPLWASTRSRQPLFGFAALVGVHRLLHCVTVLAASGHRGPLNVERRLTAARPSAAPGSGAYTLQLVSDRRRSTALR
jgi:hypothetical protein